MQVTDEMVERAQLAADALNVMVTARAMRAALTAALVDVPAVEPVAWRTRGMNARGDWVPWVMVDEQKALRWKNDLSYKNGRRQVEPLYTSPPLSREGEDSAEVERALAFVARWAWREDPSNAVRKLTDAERLSAIKHHPTIKALAATRSGSATTSNGGGHG